MIFRDIPEFARENCCFVVIDMSFRHVREFVRSPEGLTRCSLAQRSRAAVGRNSLSHKNSFFEAFSESPMKFRLVERSWVRFLPEGMMNEFVSDE